MDKDYEIAKKYTSFRRYLLAYKRAYHNLLWELEENEILLRFRDATEYNEWQLNEALYRYAESSISALCWLFPEKKNLDDFPFVHQFLREWRNINHHEERYDFSPYDVSAHVNGQKHEFSLGYYIFPFIELNKRLNKLIKKQFTSLRVATDATVSGLVLHHHTYMKQVFVEYEGNLKKDNPTVKIFLKNRSVYNSISGGSYNILVGEDDFWNVKSTVAENTTIEIK